MVIYNIQGIICFKTGLFFGFFTMYHGVGVCGVLMSVIVFFLFIQGWDHRH